MNDSGTWTWVDDAWHHISVSTSTSAGATTHNIFVDGTLLPPKPDDSDDYDEGGAGVREPRRPRPFAPADALALEDEPMYVSSF